ncbi:hypothetical protein [Rhodoferax sp.]|uniref:hypothetical protein n=2 Tax=Comamonadaceae TaxID=80864 RepID=UPI00272EEF86|nr:hypothetical protein [Rhodoferax sp.]MDP2440203.1 hypothetical protein [Rhodoferax sp.]
MAYSKLEFNKSAAETSYADEGSLDQPMTSHGGKHMFSFRNLMVAGVACIPVIGLLFGALIGLGWLRAFMTLGNWRAFPLALFVATIYFVLNIVVFAPVLAEFMAAKLVLAFLFTAWGVSVVGQQIDQAQAEEIDGATEARKLDRTRG